MPPFQEFLFHPWVEATLSKLSPREQLAQLVHVAGWSNRGEAHERALMCLVRQEGIGGIIFFQGTPERQLTLTRQYQAAAQVPLLISIDAEWGLGMRLDRSQSFPHQIALGAIQDDQLIYDMGRELGRQCRRIGIHMNFAPCVDVNVEPNNPVIGFRSFGSDPQLVARKARAYMDGLQDAGILAVAKHFPGHGDTAVDSHLDLPSFPHSTQRLESIELLPFRELIRGGVAGVMPGHLRVPAIDPREHVGGTLSAPIIQGLLREHLEFEGLVITDALDMQGVTKHFPPGEIERLAFEAGNDILLFPSDVPLALARLQEALEDGHIAPEDLKARCRRVLAAKAWAGAHEDILPVNDHLQADLHRQEAITLIQWLHSASLCWEGPTTLPFPDGGTAVAIMNPLEQTDELKHHQLSKGQQRGLPFQEKLDASLLWQLRQVDPREEVESITPPVNPWILSVHGLAVKAQHRFGLHDATIRMVERYLALRPDALVWFGSPYALRHIRGWQDIPVLHVFQDSEPAQKAAAEAIMGNSPVTGKLSVEVSG